MQGQNGKPILLENTIYLQGEWEVCLSQMYYTKNSDSIYSDSYNRIVILPVEKPETEDEALAWNNVKKTLSDIRCDHMLSSRTSSREKFGTDVE